MKRRDWLDRLWETIEARRALPFEWGKAEGAQDCYIFVAACVDAMTDSNFVEQMLARYSDEASARDVLFQAGGHVSLVSEYLGPPARIAYMRRGDVALVCRGGMEFLGICVGTDIATATPAGLALHPREYATACWSV